MRDTSLSRGASKAWLACIYFLLTSPRTTGFSVSQSHSFSVEQYSKVGASISTLTNSADGWELAARFWLPTDEDLPPHLTQAVHQEKRQRWASQLLAKLGGMIFLENSHAKMQIGKSSLCRLIQAAAIPSTSSADRVEKEGMWLLDALVGIHALVGRHPQVLQETSIETCELEEAMDGIQLLMDRVVAFGKDYSLDQACKAYWAMEGLCIRHPSHLKFAAQEDLAWNERINSLPFAIIPQAIHWSDWVSPQENVVDALLEVIPFKKDTITTRTGSSVLERRGTAWIAAEGIGALAYSGKLMSPRPLPELVQNVMRKVEKQLDIQDPFFDCALCNHYAEATAACKFHTDPEHGSMWDRTTVVVAAGSDRVFAFKPIETTCEDWDVLQTDNKSKSSTVAATVTLFSGDLVVMRENCNDDFYHAVHAGLSDDPRVSLVFKKAMGPKGHGLAGQGKRRRGKRAQVTSSMLNNPGQTEATGDGKYSRNTGGRDSSPAQRLRQRSSR